MATGGHLVLKGLKYAYFLKKNCVQKRTNDAKRTTRKYSLIERSDDNFLIDRVAMSSENISSKKRKADELDDDGDDDDNEVKSKAAAIICDNNHL